MRFAGVALAVMLSACASAPRAPAAQCSAESAGLTDLTIARDAVRAHMAYPLGGGVSVDDVFASLQGEAVAARGDRAQLVLMEHFAYGLADHHIELNTNSRVSPRLVPSGASVWVETRDGQVIVTQVRPGSPARAAGLREGMVIDAINGAPPSALALPPHTSEREAFALGFAARVALAGTHVEDTRVVAHDGARRVDVTVSLADSAASEPVSLSYPAPDVALIRINNTLGDNALPPAFDAIMQRARTARVIILDLRDTPSGGDSVVAKPIMSWFVHGTRGYQRHRRGAREWTEQVRGRRDAFGGRLIVLVDHWTGSMGEGTAIGLRAAAGATLVGTRMAGLRGAIESFDLPCLRASIRLPVEQLFTTDGQPRELVAPDVELSEAGLAAAGEGDAVMARALSLAAR